MLTAAAFLVGACFLATSTVPAQVPAPAAEKPAPISVLIIDGQNVSVHHWKDTTPAIKQAFEATGRFKVSVLTSPPAKSPKDAWDNFKPEFSKYQAVLLNYQGDTWPQEVQTAFEKYMAEGGGLVVYHFSCAAFPNWDAYNKMISIGWARDPKTNEGLCYDENGKEVRRVKGEGKGGFHGAAHVFECKVIDSTDPITKGLPAKWSHVKDELYGSLRGPAKDMHVLVTSFSDKGKGGTGMSEPMAWTVPFGKGRVFVNVLGHDVPETRAADTMILLERGTEWAAGQPVTLSVPADFPK